MVLFILWYFELSFNHLFSKNLDVIGLVDTTFTQIYLSLISLWFP